MTQPMDTPLRPASWWYGVGGGLIALGVIAAIVIFAVAFRDTFDEFIEIEEEIDNFQRVAAPGTREIDLPRAGEFTVYVEGTFTSSDVVDSPQVTIESVEPDSRPLVLSRVTAEFTYDFNGPAVRSVFRFDAPEPGRYRVEVGNPPPGVTGVAIGDDIDIFGAVGSVLVAIFVPMGVGSVLTIAGIVVLIVTAVRRSKAQRQRRQAALAGTWAGPPPPTQNWPPPAPPTWPPPPPS